jgi:Tfp pilus assembly protein PilE
MKNIIENGPKRSRKGCVIEAFVGIFIVLILAAIAIPDFFKFQAKGCSHEAKCHLGRIFTAQYQYFAEHNTYAGGNNCFEILDVEPNKKRLFSYYCGGNKIPCTKCKEPCPDPPMTLISKSGFTVMAVGNYDDDPDCAVYTIDDSKNVRQMKMITEVKIIEGSD